MNDPAKILIVVTSHGDIDDVPTTGIWFSEFSEPFEIFRAANFSLTVASPRGGPSPVDPRHYPTRDEIVFVRDALEVLNRTLHVSHVDARDFDALFLPGGHGPMFDTATDADVKRLVRDFAEARKPVAAVCHGPAGLLNVGLSNGAKFLAGRRVTGFSHGEDRTDALFAHLPFALQDAMVAEGANFIEGVPHQPHIEIDEELITGQNPESAKDVARALAAALTTATSHA